MFFSLGSEVLEGGIGNFAYTTVSKLRSQGIEAEDLTDADAETLIRNASSAINLMTGQWFEPIRLVAHFSGAGGQFLNLHSAYAPAINVSNVEVSNDRSIGGYSWFGSVRSSTNGLPQADVSLAHSGKSLFLVNSRWPRGMSNVLIDGYFGYVENKKHIQTIMSGTVSSGTSSVTLASTTPGPANTFTDQYRGTPLHGFDGIFRPRDVLIFLDSNDQEIARRILNTVDYTTNQVTFDPLLEVPPFAIGSGTKVVSYGSVPKLIELACIRVIKDLFAAGSSDSENSPTSVAGLKMEKTDNYMWQRFTALEGASAFFNEMTSDPFINNILFNFSRDPYVSV